MEKLPKKSIEFIVSEHSANMPKEQPIEKYPELTKEGVRLAQERAEDFARIIEGAEPGTVFWVGGNSYMPRTRSTLEVYTDTLHERFAGAEADTMILISKKEIKEAAAKGYSEAVASIVEKAHEHPEAKILIDLPFRIKQISQKDWYVVDGRLKQYQEELIKKYDLFSEYGENFSNATRERFTQPDTREDGEKVPHPEEVAKSYLGGLNRLKNFARKHFQAIYPRKVAFRNFLWMWYLFSI